MSEIKMQLIEIDGKLKEALGAVLNGADEWTRELYERGADADAREFEQAIEYIEQEIKF